MQTSLAKKIFAIGSTSAMLLAAVPFVASAAVHSAGTNVVSNGTVYFVNSNGQKQPYTSAGAFLSYGFNTWADVVAASAEDLALPTGSFVPPSDGSLINDKGTVYLMVNGMPSGFTTESNFLGLGYSYKNVLAGDVSFLAKGSNIGTTAMSHPVGTLVNDKGTVYLMTASGKMGIPSLSTFNSWGYSFAKVVPANSYDSAIAMSSGIMNARVAGQLNPTGSTVNIPPVSGNLSVSAASDMPVTRTLVKGEAVSDLAHFTFYGTGTVTAVTLKRFGVSADATLNNVYLFDGSTRLTDSASVSSGSTINFTNASGLFTVNGSKTIAVRADILSTAAAGETVGVQLTSAMSGSNSVSGTPVSGNLHTVATATLATVALGAVTQSGATNPGTDINVWQSTATVSTRDVLMTRLALRQVGSIVSADVNNFKLFVDGVQVSSAASLDSNGYVTFSFSKALTTGNRTLKVTADVIGGSGRNVEFSLRGAYDISVTDTQYNAGVTATASAFPLDAGATFNISAGSMTVVKATDSQSQNVTLGATDQSLAKYTFTAYGEQIKVETLRVGVITTGGTVTDHTLRNVRILVNGLQVGSTTNVPAAATFASGAGTQFTTNFTVVPGTPATVEIRGDLVDSEGTDDIAAGTVTAVQALLIGGTSANNAIPQVSLGTLDVPTADNTLGNSLTIASGSMSLTQQSTYSGQTVVAPQTAYKIGAFNLTGNSTEAVNLNTIEVDFNGSATEATVLTDVYVKYGTQTTAVKGTVAEADNTWSISRTLAVNETMPVEIYATIGSTLSTSTVITLLTVTGITASSGLTTYADVNSDTIKDAGFTGQTITGGAGTFTVSADATTPDSAIVDDSGTVNSAAFKFVTVSDAYTITDITLTLGDASAVNTVTLMDNGVAVTGGSKPGAATVTYSGLSIPVAANTSKVITVQLTMSPVGVGAGTAGASLLTTLTSATARSSGGTSAAVTEATVNPAGNAMYVYKAIPTITNVALPSSALNNGIMTVAKFTVSSGGTGTISWQKLAFTVTKNLSGTDTLASPTLWNSDTNTQISGTGLFTGSIEVDNDTAGGIEFVANSEQSISGAKTYELRVTVAGVTTTGDNMTVQIAQPSAFAAQTAAFALHSASSASYYDADAGTTVTAGDVRQTALASVAAAGNNTLVIASPVNTVRSTYGLTTAADSTKTITLTESGVDNVLTGITTNDATLTSCLAYTAADGGGSATTTISAILSVKCTGTGKQLIMNVAGTAANATASQVTIVTLTVTDGAYVVGSTVAANNSDLGLALTGGVAPAASFVWSDQSDAGHDSTTTDWTNGLSVKNLPTVTQSLTR
ncbi:MAG: beta strand repeat-containing protein [Candidatus Doudnabacteria bacterium]